MIELARTYYNWHGPGPRARTLTAILGRMACEATREAAWDEMMRSA
jgi:hypothetical protein